MGTRLLDEGNIEEACCEWYSMSFTFGSIVLLASVESG